MQKNNSLTAIILVYGILRKTIRTNLTRIYTIQSLIFNNKLF